MESAWLTFTASLRLTFRHIGLLLIVNILWWLFSLLLITWPPATAGLFTVARRIVNPDEDDLEETTWHHFFIGFKQYWLNSWPLAIVDLAGVIVIGIVFLFYFNNNIAILRLIAVPVFYIGLIWIGLQLYLFPILIAQETKDIRLVFKNAYILMMRNIIFSITFGLLLLSVILVSSTLLGPILLILISFLAVAQTLGLKHVMGAT